jgi:hypothetical protein
MGRNKNFKYSEEMVIELFKTSGYLVVNKKLIKVLGLIPTILLSEYIDKYQYFKNKPNFNGSFFFSHESIIDNLQLSEYTLRQAKHLLKQLKILSVTRKGVPAREWVTIDFTILFSYIFGVAERSNTIGLERVNTNGHNEPINNNKKNKQKKTVSERDKEYIPLARTLSKIAKKRKRYKHPYKIIKGWATHFRQLVEINKVSVDRIEDVLDWYSKHYNDPWVPVADAGITFREKFTRLEDAMERNTPKSKVPPESIIERRLKGTKAAEWMLRNFSKLVKDKEFDDESLVADNMCSLYESIVKARPDNAMTRTAHSDSIGSPAELVQEYIWWLNNQSWLDNITPSAFVFEAKLFKQFLKYQNEQLGINVLTGV